MATRIQHEDASAPFWLLTMGDMNNLLLLFFIALFALMVTDKGKYMKLDEKIKQMGSTGKAPDASRVTSPAAEGASQAFRTMLDQPAARTEVFQAEGHYALVQRIPEGTVLTISGQEGSFPEGQWALNDVQKRMLVEVKRWLVGRRNVVEIRGHTAANLEDSAVQEPDGRIRPFTRDDLARDDRQALANHSLLSWLRAHEVKKFLAEEHPDRGDAVRVSEAQLRLRADGWTRAVADSSDAVERVKNRRLEVVATSEMVER